MTPYKDLVKDGTYVAVLDNFKADPMPISFVYPNRRNVPTRVKIFMDWIEETLQGYILKAPKHILVTNELQGLYASIYNGKQDISLNPYVDRRGESRVRKLAVMCVRRSY